MTEQSQWEIMLSGTSHLGQSKYPWDTMRLKILGGWLYVHSVYTAVGPLMTSVFVPETGTAMQASEAAEPNEQWHDFTVE